MTYSIVARDTATGDLGVAVQSHFFGAGAVVPWGRAGVGVVATQSVVDPGYGPRLLDALACGRTPRDALEHERRADPRADLRQVAVLDAQGRSAVFTGEGCIGHAGSSVSPNVSAQANLVASAGVWPAMVTAFETTSGVLAERLLAALRAAEAAGGDLRGRQAAGLLVVRGVPTGDPLADVVTDIRVDDSADPLGDLQRLLPRSTALDGLVAMLSTEGLLTGPLTAAPDVVQRALDELARAQELTGPDNVEPTVWRGLLLARCGRDRAARDAFGLARRVLPDVDHLVRQLVEAGMWARPTDDLDRVLRIDPTSKGEDFT